VTSSITQSDVTGFAPALSMYAAWAGSRALDSTAFWQGQVVL
jgi:hypothetical protein